jgi:hypothetical protein
MVLRAGINRPFKFGSKDRREYIVHENEEAIRAQNDANGNVIYLGRARVGTLDGEVKWQISFHAYDANDSLTSQTWPQNDEGSASSEYEFEWDERTSYIFS